MSIVDLDMTKALTCSTFVVREEAVIALFQPIMSSLIKATQQFSFQKVTIYTDRNRDLTGGKIAIANQCWTGVISAIQSL
ncbi:MAG: hypothetical protein IM577_15065 [Chitinophagaceae bacterium]|jgi:hypothetical protein|nr:hypothetical protein [Chitinophagaceae bacterium]